LDLLNIIHVYGTRKDNDENVNYASLDKMFLKKENYDKYETNNYNLLVLRLYPFCSDIRVLCTCALVLSALLTWWH